MQKPKPKTPITYAERMAAWRAAKGLSQSQAATAAGVSVRNWQNWEQAHRPNPRISAIRPVLELIAKDGF